MSSRVQLFVTLWTVAHQAPLSMGTLQARILEWVAMPASRGLPHPGIEPRSLKSALACRFFTTSATWTLGCRMLKLDQLSFPSAGHTCKAPFPGNMTYLSVPGIRMEASLGTFIQSATGGGPVSRLAVRECRGCPLACPFWTSRSEWAASA